MCYSVSVVRTIYVKKTINIGDFSNETNVIKFIIFAIELMVNAKQLMLHLVSMNND